MRSLFLILSLALVSAAFAQPPQTSEIPDPKKLAAIEGTVLNSVSGEVLRRVNLSLRPTMSGTAQMGPMPPVSPYAATTDAAGKFRIERIEPGTYTLSAERQGFVRQQYNARGNSSIGTPLNIAASVEMKELNFKLIPQAIITGRVLDDEGEPLAGVGLEVSRSVRSRGKQTMMPSGGGQTNDTGEFRIANLSPGRYWLSASVRSNANFFGDGAPRNSSDKPQEAYVTTYFPASTDEAGARPVDLVAGQTLASIDIRMKKETVYRVRGKVSAPPPVKNLRVILTSREATQFRSMYGNNSGIVKEDGSFEVAQVAPGTYYLVAALAQGMIRSVGRTPIDVARENIDNVVIPYFSGITVSGTIRIDGEIPDNQKISFETMRLQFSPMEGGGFNFPGAVATAEATFKLENAGPEKYRIFFNGLPPGFWLKSISDGARDILDAGLDLSSGASAPIEVVLAPGVGVLNGVVQDSKQQPAAGVMVSLLPDPMKDYRYDLTRNVPTDQSGKFNLSNLPPGDYKVYAWENFDFANALDPESLKAYETRAKKITIKPNSQEQLTLTSIPLPGN